MLHERVEAQSLGGPLLPNLVQVGDVGLDEPRESAYVISFLLAQSVSRASFESMPASSGNV